MIGDSKQKTVNFVLCDDSHHDTKHRSKLMSENKKKNANEIKITHSDISVSVNSKDGQRKEYVFPESLPSDVIAISSVASTAADMGVQVLKPWQDKIKDEIDDIKNFPDE